MAEFKKWKTAQFAFAIQILKISTLLHIFTTLLYFLLRYLNISVIFIADINSFLAQFI